jgi:hypothetical protein
MSYNYALPASQPAVAHVSSIASHKRHYISLLAGMSGRTAEEPISLLDDDDVDSAAYDTLNSAAYAKDEVDVQIYGNSVFNPNPTPITN